MELMVLMFLLFLVSVSNAYHDGSPGRRHLETFCEDSNKNMRALGNLDSTATCADVLRVMETLGKSWYCSLMSTEEENRVHPSDQVESFAKFPGLFKGEYIAKCPTLKTTLENWKAMGDILSRKIDAALDPATYTIHHKNFGKLSDSELIKYNLYVVKHRHNHLSAYFEEPRTCSKRSHFVFHTVSWSTESYFDTLDANSEDIIENMHRAYVGVPGINKNVFTHDVPEEILRFEFPLRQMHKIQRYAPVKGELWDILGSSCAGKIFELVKLAFEEFGLAELEHTSPFYDPSEVFEYLQKLANEAPNGHLLNGKERDAIVDDAFEYGVDNWADTFDESIEFLPKNPARGN